MPQKPVCFCLLSCVLHITMKTHWRMADWSQAESARWSQVRPTQITWQPGDPRYGSNPGKAHGECLSKGRVSTGSREGVWWFAHSFPGGSDGKVSACNAGDPSSIPGSRRSPGEGNGNPLQYSCLENSMERGAL